jgi:hypothetical protein
MYFLPVRFPLFEATASGLAHVNYNVNVAADGFGIRTSLMRGVGKSSGEFLVQTR